MRTKKRDWISGAVGFGAGMLLTGATIVLIQKYRNKAEGMDRLPPEIIKMIVEKVPLSDQKTLVGLNQEFRAWAKDMTTLEKRFKSQYPDFEFGESQIEDLLYKKNDFDAIFYLTVTKLIPLRFLAESQGDLIGKTGSIALIDFIFTNLSEKQRLITGIISGAVRYNRKDVIELAQKRHIYNQPNAVDFTLAYVSNFKDVIKPYHEKLFIDIDFKYFMEFAFKSGDMKIIEEMEKYACVSDVKEIQMYNLSNIIGLAASYDPIKYQGLIARCRILLNDLLPIKDFREASKCTIVGILLSHKRFDMLEKWNLKDPVPIHPDYMISICNQGYIESIDWLIQHKFQFVIFWEDLFKNAPEKMIKQLHERKLFQITGSTIDKFIKKDRMSLVRWALSVKPTAKPRINEFQFEVFDYGKVEALTIFFESFKDQFKRALERDNNFVRTAENGHLKVLKFLHSKFPFNAKQIDIILEHSVQNGQLHILNWVKREFGKIPTDQMTTDEKSRHWKSLIGKKIEPGDIL